MTPRVPDDRKTDKSLSWRAADLLSFSSCSPFPHESAAGSGVSATRTTSREHAHTALPCDPSVSACSRTRLLASVIPWPYSAALVVARMRVSYASLLATVL